MHDWNVVITVRAGGFVPACRLLESFGKVTTTEFFNTLVMHSDDPSRLLIELDNQQETTPAITTWISRIVPIQQRFTFQSAQEFEMRSREAVLLWLPRLAHARFHVRMHRRGFRGRLFSVDEERFLDEFLLQTLLQSGTSGRISFDDPDQIIVLETVGVQAGASLFTREEMNRFPLLHLD